MDMKGAEIMTLTQWPAVVDEYKTIDRLRDGFSIGRYG